MEGDPPNPKIQQSVLPLSTKGEDGLTSLGSCCHFGTRTEGGSGGMFFLSLAPSLLHF